MNRLSQYIHSQFMKFFSCLKPRNTGGMGSLSFEVLGCPGGAQDAPLVKHDFGVVFPVMGLLTARIHALFY